MHETIKSVEDASAELWTAREKFEEANKKYEFARSVRTEALNTLNNSQKAFDASVEAVKKDPPWDSDWHSRNRHSEPVS